MSDIAEGITKLIDTSGAGQPCAVDAEPLPHNWEEILASGEPLMSKDLMKKLTVEPRYHDLAEDEIDQMLRNAKVSLTQLGYDLDKERMLHKDMFTAD